MKRFMLSCKKATELIEQRNAGSLGLVSAIRLWMHKLMCDACTAYEKQSKTIDKAMEKWTFREENDKKHRLSDDVKSSIINKINKDTD